jgi:mannose-6-phosphate isomerase
MFRFDGLLQFAPIYQTRVWGGRRLETVLGRGLPDGQPYGESWELVDRAAEQSVVARGPSAGMTLHELWTRHRAAVFGAAFADWEAPRFPLLIKVLDCAEDLSIQVHPPAAVAPALGGEPKTEMWYVAHADADAHIYAGLRAGVSRAAFEGALADGSVAACVHRLEARTGDSLFVPSGRIHALGAGLLIYEIQQNSDTTYRVFDWNRVGLDGKPRALHVRESLACIDFSDVEPALSHADGLLASADDFRVTRARTRHEARPGTFRLIMPIAPTQWGDAHLSPGELTLCPATFEISGGPQGEWLEIELGTGRQV